MTKPIHTLYGTMYDPRESVPGELYKAALKDVNAWRVSELKQPPITAMPLGVPRSHCQCPIAWALMAAGWYTPIVHISSIRLTEEDGTEHDFKPTTAMRAFIVAFDAAGL